MAGRENENPGGGGGKRFGYRAVADRAWEELGALSPDETAKRSGARMGVGGALVLHFFGGECRVDFEKREILDSAGERVGVTVEIVILHYLLSARDIPLSGRLRSFREFEGAEAFWDAFRRRVLEPLAEAFGPHPAKLGEAARALGGVPAGLPSGELNFRILAAPRLPLTVILWLGDEEVRHSSQVLFDETADRQVLVEDLAVVGEFLAYLLVRRANLESPGVGSIFTYG